jgi:hypothetical protein
MNDMMRRRSFWLSAHSYLRLHSLFSAFKALGLQPFGLVNLPNVDPSPGKTYGLLSVPELLRDGTWPPSKAGNLKV